MTRPDPSPWRALVWLILGISFAAFAATDASGAWRVTDVVIVCIDMFFAGLILGAWSEQEGS